MSVVFEPGLFSSAPVRDAILVSTIAAIVGASTGVFVVMRHQSFAAHALTDVATTGGATATYAGTSLLGGFLAGAVVGAASMDALGSDQGSSRDVATGVVLGAATGISALVLYLQATERAAAGAVQSVLFGSVFTVPRSLIAVAALVAAAVVAMTVALSRPLLLSTISPDLASSAGVRSTVVHSGYAIVLGVSVGLASLATGSVLATALVVGPAAIGCRWCRHVRAAIVVAALGGVLAATVGVVLAYDSADWVSGGRGLPASFFIVTAIGVEYLASEAAYGMRRGA